MSVNQEPVVDKVVEAFNKKYPNCPHPKKIEVLNLIMRREFAEQIIRGEKKVEYRACSKHYCDRLFDKDCFHFIETTEGLTEEEAECVEFIRPVKMIHFHNYSNSFFLDVECHDNYMFALLPHNVKMMQDEYNCHDFDEMLADFERRNSNYRPSFFYFPLGKIIKTNIKL